MSQLAAGGRRVGSDITIQLVARLFNLALGIVVTVALIRHLGDEQFGRWATIFAVVEVVGYFSELGLEQVAVRHAAADPRRESDWLGALIGLRLAISVPVTVVCLAILLPLSQGADMRAASVLVTATTFTGAVSASRSVFQLRVRNDVTMAMLTLSSSLWLVGVLLIVRGDGGLAALAAAFLAAAALTNALQLALAMRTTRLNLRPNRGMWLALARAGIPLGIAQLLALAYVRIDGVLVFKLAGAAEAGLYASVYRMLDRAQFIPVAVITTLFPLMAAARGTSMSRLRELFTRSIDALVILTLPAIPFTLVAGDAVVRLLFGDEFAPAAAALPVLMGALVAASLVIVATYMLVVLDLQARLIRYALSALVLNVALNVALIPRYGFLAAAWIAFLTQALVAILALRTVVGEVGWAPRAGRILRCLAAATALGLLLWGLRETGASLGALMTAAAAAYPALVVGLRVVEPRELVRLVRPWRTG